MTNPAATIHASLNAVDPRTGGVAAIWTIRCCPVCEPGLVADVASPEHCREHGGDPRIDPTSSGQPSIRAGHEPLHTHTLAQTAAEQRAREALDGRPSLANPFRENTP